MTFPQLAKSYRRRGLLVLLIGAAAVPQTASAAQSPQSAPSAAHDGSHDFDWEFGTWKTELKRLKKPLSGSTEWIPYTGTTVVRKIWNGKANLVELEVDGPTGHFQALSLRLYNPASRQWTLNFANSAVGAISLPSATGEFKNGVGTFYNQDTYNDRVILVRFVMSNITPKSAHFEQFFSDDGGKTWELNWVADDTRIGPAPAD